MSKVTEVKNATKSAHKTIKTIASDRVDINGALRTAKHLAKDVAHDAKKIGKTVPVGVAKKARGFKNSPKVKEADKYVSKKSEMIFNCLVN